MHSNSTRKASQSTSKVPLFVSLAVLLGLLGCYFFWPDFHDFVKSAFKILTSDDRQKIKQWVSQFGFWGPFMIVLAMVLQMFLIVINAVALMVVAVLAYGPVWGSVVALAAVAVASTIGYWLGRLLGEHAIGKLIGQKSEEKVQHFVEEYGFWAVVIARISPFLSNDAISFIAGISCMSYWRFILATLMGILPLTILIAWLSVDIGRLKNGLIWISVISIAGFGLYVWLDHRKKKQTGQAP